MPYVWINPVTNSMYEPEILDEFLHNHGYKRFHTSVDWLAIVIARFLSENEKEALQMVAEKLDLEVAAVEEMYALYDFSTEILEKDKQGFQITADFMFESGMIENKLEVDKLFLE